jgi:prepilin-type processing-associated H-X9-DG protein
MQVSTNDGGTLEYVQNSYLIPNLFYFQYRHFQPLSNYLATPAVLVCPTDIERQTASSFSGMNNSDISYFVGANADYAMPNSILAGDRNVTNAGVGEVTIVRLADGSIVKWTEMMHVLKGNVLFADGRVDELNSVWVSRMTSGGPTEMDLVLPTTTTNSSRHPSSPPHYSPPPGVPMPGTGRQFSSRITITSSQSPSRSSGGGSQGGRSPQGGGVGASSSPPPRYIPPPMLDQSTPPPPVKTFTTAPRSNAPIVTNEPEPSPIVAAAVPPPTPVPSRSHWWWWLLLLLLLIIAVQYFRYHYEVRKRQR